MNQVEGRRSMARKKKQYHHGDLREACIQEGLNLLKEKGPHDLSLRDIARRLGVSHGAPYRHFPHRDAILAAIAEQGFLKFAEYLRLPELEHTQVEPLDRFRAMGHAFLRFALENKESFQLMFAQVIEDHMQYEGLRQAGEASFRILLDTVVKLQEEALFREGDPLITSLHIWSTLHGFASLALDDRFQFLEIGSEAYVGLLDQISEGMMQGLLPKS